MKLIALITDFGYKDPYVAQMLGVMKSIAPDSEFIHITHDVPPQNIVIAHLILKSSVEFFPSGTIFLTVVDPGVGTERESVAVVTDRYVFVGPDNGLFSGIGEWGGATRAIHRLTNQEYYRASEISHSFHGRDIFAPAAAWLARGVAIDRFGSPQASVVNMSLPKSEEKPRGWSVPLVYIDHFGNIMFAMTRDEWRERVGDFSFELEAGDHIIRELSCHFQSAAPLIAHFNSFQLLEIAAPNGAAARLFGLNNGDEFSVLLRLADG